MGHEIGHHEARHVLNRLGRNLGVNILFAMLGISNMSGSDFFGGIQELSFSRGDEEEADAFGVDLVRDQFQSYEGVTEFFEYVQTLEDVPQNDNELANIFSTHPMTQKRIDRIKRLLQEKK